MTNPHASPRGKRGKQLSGGAKLKASGRKAILLGVTPAQLAALQQAAHIEGRPVSQFVAFHAIEFAGRLLKARGFSITCAKCGCDLLHELQDPKAGKAGAS